jgi:hypothetical protein
MVLPSAPRSSQWSLSCKFAHLYSFLTHKPTCPTHPPWFHHPTDTRWTHHEAPHSARLLLPLLPYAQCLPQHPILKHPWHTFFHMCQSVPQLQSAMHITNQCILYALPAVTKSILVQNILLATTTPYKDHVSTNHLMYHLFSSYLHIPAHPHKAQSNPFGFH